jgi:hypothetical protein
MRLNESLLVWIFWREITMEQALHSVETYPDHTVEIVVHITETLDEKQREELVNALESSGGITTAEFCPLRYHLMLVRYDRDLYSSQDVLDRVKSQNLDARLIGPL